MQRLLLQPLYSFLGGDVLFVCIKKYTKYMCIFIEKYAKTEYNRQNLIFLKLIVFGKQSISRTFQMTIQNFFNVNGGQREIYDKPIGFFGYQKEAHEGNLRETQQND